jgi:hypothetical protein
MKIIAQTGWSESVTINRLVIAGDAFISGDTVAAGTIASELRVRTQIRQIELQAEARIKRIKGKATRPTGNARLTPSERPSMTPGAR